MGVLRTTPGLRMTMSGFAPGSTSGFTLESIQLGVDVASHIYLYILYTTYPLDVDNIFDCIRRFNALDKLFRLAVEEQIAKTSERFSLERLC